MKEWGFKHISLYFFRSIEMNKLKQCCYNFALWDPILDLGCGDGTFTKEFFGEGRNITGIDNSQRELDKNKCYRTYKELLLENACNMTFKNKSFNTVFSNSVIEHIPDLDNLLNEVSRVLKPGGYFVFTVPTDNFKHFLLFSFSKWYANARNKRLNHYHCYSYRKWWDILREKGLKVENYEYYLPKKALKMWDFLALATFHFWWITFPFAKLLYAQVEKGIKQHSKERVYYNNGGEIVIIAKKEGV